MPSVDTARAILSTLDALGVTHVLYCPGSRSAPFAYALESGAFGGHARAVLDERGAGFAAVGLARTGALPAVIVTSGTAVAELAPAVLEASHARLPLLVVSADRPGELRGVGASQATDQARLFNTHARACVDLEPQEPSPRLVGQLSRALAAATGAPTGAPGPVQLNVAFRDPLTPQAPAPSEGGLTGDEAPASFVPRPTRVLPARPAPSRWEDVVGQASAGLIVAGEGASPRAAHWSQASGFPLLAEPASGAWALGGVTPFEQAIVSSDLARQVDTVVVTGRPTLSRPIHALLARPDVRVVVADPCAPWVDISGNATTVVADLQAPEGPVPGRLADWSMSVQALSAGAGARIDQLLARESGRTMIDLARAVASATSGPLVLGASNPVRAFDLGVASLSGRLVYSNRGQAGTGPSPPRSAWPSGSAPSPTLTRPRPPDPLGAGKQRSRPMPRASPPSWVTSRCATTHPPSRSPRPREPSSTSSSPTTPAAASSPPSNTGAPPPPRPTTAGSASPKTSTTRPSPPPTASVSRAPPTRANSPQSSLPPRRDPASSTRPSNGPRTCTRPCAARHVDGCGVLTGAAC